VLLGGGDSLDDVGRIKTLSLLGLELCPRPSHPQPVAKPLRYLSILKQKTRYQMLFCILPHEIETCVKNNENGTKIL
jgi:hypothetical protein